MKRTLAAWLTAAATIVAGAVHAEINVGVKATW